jgi:hypothetical protein
VHASLIERLSPKRFLLTGERDFSLYLLHLWSRPEILLPLRQALL